MGLPGSQGDKGLKGQPVRMRHTKTLLNLFNKDQTCNLFGSFHFLICHLFFAQGDTGKQGFPGILGNFGPRVRPASTLHLPHSHLLFGSWQLDAAVHAACAHAV